METVAGINIDAFALRLRKIDEVDPALLHGLSVAVGWQHRQSDWQMLLDIGDGLAAVDEIGRVAGTVMWQRYGADFAMIGMLITSPRLQEQGAGRWLMDNAHALNPGRAFGLNATQEARRLYRSLGYTHEHTILRCQGEVLPDATRAARIERNKAAGTIVRALTPADRPGLLALDRAATGYDRGSLFDALLATAQGQVLERGGKVVGFALCRPFGRGHVLGPVVTVTEDDAVAVSLPIVEAHAGRFLRADTSGWNSAFTSFLVASGMTIHDSATSMGLGKAPYVPVSPDGPRRFALASQALG